MRGAWLVVLVAGCCLLGRPADSPAQTSRPPRAGTPPPVSRNLAAAAVSDIEERVTALLANYEARLSREILFQTQGWYPTFFLLHGPDDIAVNVAGGQVASVTVRFSYGLRGVDAGLPLPQETGFMMPDTEGVFLGIMAKSVSDALRDWGGGTQRIVFAVSVPRVDGEGDLVWFPAAELAFTAAEARSDQSALAKRFTTILSAPVPR